MSLASARIEGGKPGQSGIAVDRARAVRFTLDGQEVTGFAGDTVLSALTALGIDTLGSLGGHPVALSARFSPAVVPARFSGDPAAAVPMARMPAIEGAEFVTPGRPLAGAAAAGVKRLFAGRDRSLGLRFDRAGEFVEPWRVSPASETLEVDLLVVGGGVAGMSAAIAGSAAGRSVLLVERRPYLGGDAAFYGAVEDEEAPEAMVARLAGEIEGRARITLRLNTEAIRLVDGVAALHGLAEGGRGQRVDVRAGAVVLATGAFERLPVFAGNRHPGVAGAVAAYHELRQYALWPGRSAIIATQGNFAYRLALQASDCGIDIRRFADTRINPQSRFIDFCKASGITMSAGLVPQAVAAQPRSSGLVVGLAAAVEGIQAPADPAEADRLVVAGGWQPDLTLWCRAGGGSAWNPRSGRLEPRGELAGIALAGSAAGLRNNGSCAASGTASVARLLGRTGPALEDPQIAAIYETPDDPTPLVPVASGKAGPAFLDAGATLMTRPGPQPQGLVERLLNRRAPVWAPLDEGHALGLCDLVACIQLGAVERRAAGALARERCVSPAQVATGHPPARRGDGADPTPAFLAGRFGTKRTLWTVLADDSRFFDTGCLVFADPADTDPHRALGVIVGPAPDRRHGGVALIGRPDVTPGQRLIVRDENGPVTVRLIAVVAAADRPGSGV